MTTSISKAVPRSRLNITYRTQIDGQVVRKELPLRLLIAGDFSGRAEPLAPGEHARPLPHLSQRLIYSIGQEGSLESILSRSRVSLPIPRSFATERRFCLVGDATVRVECNRDVDNNMTFQLWVKTSRIEQAIELQSGDAAKVAADSALYSGELFSGKVFTITEVKADSERPVWPSVAPDASSESLKTWSKKQAAVAPGFTKDGVWVSAAGTDLHGWLEPPVSPAKEPPSLFDLVGHDVKVWFQFDTDLAASFDTDGRQSAEFRVRVAVTSVLGHSAIRLADMDSLSPERVAQAVPQIRRLLVIRWLLSQGRSMLSSNPVLRNHVKVLLQKQKDNLPALAKVEAQAAIGKLLNDPDPAKVAAVTTTDTDAKDVQKFTTTPPQTDADKAAFAKAKQAVLSDEWALRNAIAAWDLEVQAAKDSVDQSKNATLQDPDVVELRRIRALPSKTDADVAKEAELKKKLLAAPGPRPDFGPWHDLRRTVEGLKLDNFKL